MTKQQTYRSLILIVILISSISCFNLETMYGCILALFLVFIGDELLKFIPFLKDK